mmetsp:Transcript_97243/g.217931  ORF Transcript_97243/g.217931 Transcript_97243/m.217931 type:complete len:113 (+) Transcript_97243:213-551(+)
MNAHGLQTPNSWPSEPTDGSMGDPKSIGSPAPMGAGATMAAGMAGTAGATTAAVAGAMFVKATGINGGIGEAPVPDAAAAASASATLKIGGAVLKPVSARPPKAPPKAPAGV